MKSIAVGIVMCFMHLLSYSCHAQVLSLSQEGLTNENYQNDQHAFQEQAAEIIKTNDLKSCQKIKDSTYRVVCINNIALNLAKGTNDISYCQKVDNKLVSIEECERQVILAISVKSENINICQKIKSQDLREKCQGRYYLQHAIKNNDIRICDQSRESADFCYNNFLVGEKFIKDIANFDCSLLRGIEAQKDCQVMKKTPDAMVQGSNSCIGLKTDLFLPYCLP